MERLGPGSRTRSRASSVDESARAVVTGTKTPSVSGKVSGTTGAAGSRSKKLSGSKAAPAASTSKSKTVTQAESDETDWDDPNSGDTRDERLAKLERLKVTELRDLCAPRKLTKTGKKAELIKKLLDTVRVAKSSKRKRGDDDASDSAEDTRARRGKHGNIGKGRRRKRGEEVREESDSSDETTIPTGDVPVRPPRVGPDRKGDSKKSDTKPSVSSSGKAPKTKTKASTEADRTDPFPRVVEESGPISLHDYSERKKPYQPRSPSPPSEIDFGDIPDVSADEPSPRPPAPHASTKKTESIVKPAGGGSKVPTKPKPTQTGGKPSGTHELSPGEKRTSDDDGDGRPSKKPRPDHGSAGFPSHSGGKTRTEPSAVS